MDMNNNLRDVHRVHDIVTFFAAKKKMPLNEKKCNIFIVNGKTPFPTPVLRVNGKEMATEASIRYLGDIFNTRGNNRDLIKDRVDRGRRCIINSILLH